ncbi:conjugal transfer protein [Thermoactinomyces sp. CICC 10521]|uniref:conjugal transfer protein n=1 Tax=Thermoactinomyces sp. CICC 10521 TaxID=2767426 RepID=UPI0018DB9711|nr:conjugal transfer protein [Thermoactinomyces sp. CICC 10521]MBH8608943.1 conjugal transfer protein [Thermoactinomyces sp. CICC 10521]
MNLRKVRLVVSTSIIVALAAKGAYDIVAPPRTQVSAEKTNDKIAPVFVDSSQGAENYAVYFANYWLTGDIESAKRYAAKGFDVSKDLPRPIKIETIAPWGARSIEKNKVSIIVRVKPVGSNPFFVEVPVVVNQGRYGVVGLPNFIPEPAKASKPDNPDIDETQDLATKQQVEQVIESFFRQYTAGTPEDLANLYADGKSRKVLGMNATFENISALEVSDPEDNKLYARCTARLNINGVSVPQQYEFWFEKDGNRWLIDSTNPMISTP